MNTVWTIITIISSTVVATVTVIGIYYSHRSKILERLKDLEKKMEHHEKFIGILEKKALDALEEEFSNNNKGNGRSKRK